MITMLLQPLLFIFVMGTGLGSIVDTGGGTSFRTFLFPGVLATSVLFTAAFAGISLVWDREFGLDRKSTRLNSSHANISYAVFRLKNKTRRNTTIDILAFVELADIDPIFSYHPSYLAPGAVGATRPNLLLYRKSIRLTSSFSHFSS